MASAGGAIFILGTFFILSYNRIMAQFTLIARSVDLSWRIEIMQLPPAAAS